MLAPFPFRRHHHDWVSNMPLILPYTRFSAKSILFALSFSIISMSFWISAGFCTEPLAAGFSTRQTTTDQSPSLPASASWTLALHFSKMLKISLREIVLGRRKLHGALQYAFCFVVEARLQ